MFLARLIISTLAVLLQPVLASELAALDNAGREVAEKPCPKPKISIKVKKSIHDETVTNRYVTLKCPGASSEIVKSSESKYKHTFPVFANVSQADLRIPSAFQIGVLLTSIKGRLGAPEDEKIDSITYLLPSETLEERVTFYHDGKRVVGVQWSWYFD